MAEKKLPSFLRLLAAEQRANFQKINAAEEARIDEGLRHWKDSKWSMADSLSFENEGRNRYSNVLPWNRSRVKLPLVSSKMGSDYINASYINNGTGCRFIATQGPLENTQHHFWSMCYNESEKQGCDVVIIAMMTPTSEGGITKCSRYWPTPQSPSLDLGEINRLDGIAILDLPVHHKKLTPIEGGDIILTEFDLCSSFKRKKVYHFFYQKWADSRVPPSILSLFSLSRDIRNLQKHYSCKPIPIVHCSAGVGRTGTFIVLDELIHNKEVLKNVDLSSDYDPICDLVSNLRESRMMMVQTPYQYCFLYDFAKELLTIR